MQKLYDDFARSARVFVVYIAEAHPTDEWQLESNEHDGVLLAQHRDFDDRRAAAAMMADKLALSIPQLVDGMDNAAAEAFAAWPERLFVVDRAGEMAYCGAPGPYGFEPDEARAALERLIEAVE